ncbi:hypothetical protein N7468_005469 [Penicillium chermesinum]|uniref:Uncharacterized protein n=1 Tax=Penicillium chermesinum TaxID=63820 RepID=A0A9W9P1X3_9EURO|nr:uncharacterized protein N7468_005469 [Penicillium chermesinum]KAJ5232513.1 hypothetical protein N7468_005469 [Penicillium chermesinum]
MTKEYNLAKSFYPPGERVSDYPSQMELRAAPDLRIYDNAAHQSYRMVKISRNDWLALLSLTVGSRSPS